MRRIAILAITVLLVVVVIALVSQLLHRNSEYPGATVDVRNLAVAIKKNSESIALLSAEVRELHGLLGQKDSLVKEGASAGGDVVFEGLVDRVDRVEVAIEELSSVGIAPVKKSGAGIEKQFSERVRSPAEISSYNQNRHALAEADFEQDSGTSLGDFTHSLDDALHAVEGIDVSDVSCRDTICKVTYSRTESLEVHNESGETLDLVDKLALDTVGREVDVRYVKDSFGSNVMYIQLR